MAENTEISTDINVIISKTDMQAIIDKINEQKEDIIALVSVFSQFSGLFSGNSTVMSIVPVIMKLMSDKSAMEKFSAIVPIIDKYTQRNHGENQY